MADILPSHDAEQLIDFTCESPWERFALDTELIFRAWNIQGNKLGASAPSTPPSAPLIVPIAGLETAALAARTVSLAERKFLLHLRNDAPNCNLDASPLQRLLGAPICIMLLSANGDSTVAWDASDAVSLLSALSVAATASEITIPLLVPVGRASEFRLLGRRTGWQPARYSCDCNSYVPDTLGHLAGLLELFASKRNGASRRTKPPSRGLALISAKFTYTWSDFSLRVPTPQSHRLAVVHADALTDNDPVRSLRLAAIWDGFPALELAKSADRAAMRAPTADRIRLAPSTLHIRARPPPPLAAPSRACLRLALWSDTGAPAAAASLVEASVGGARGNADAFAAARALYLADARNFLAAVALEHKAIDDEFILGALAALFDMGGTRGLMGDVMDALGPLAQELPLVERLARLVGAMTDVRSVLYLWCLFIDGVEMHWIQRRELPDVGDQGPMHYECLLLQKLQMIQCCIVREGKEAKERNERKGDIYGRKQEMDDGGWEPFVQDSSLVTRDVVEAKHDRMITADERSKEEMRTLTSDMSAFKAANPNAKMAHFVRWFSPSDWTSGELSLRMRKPGNEWQVLWNAAKPQPAHMQTALFNPAIHGKRALQDLRQMPLSAVLLQLACTTGLAASNIMLDALQTCALPRVCALTENARAAFRAFAARSTLRYADDANALNDAVDILAAAENSALVASSLRLKLPDVGEFGRAIDAVAVGDSFDFTGSTERALLASIARLDDADWRAALLPEHREFLLLDHTDEEGDRMYARLSGDEFRTAFRLCVDYST